jgi:hypothetical protein
MQPLVSNFLPGSGPKEVFGGTCPGAQYSAFGVMGNALINRAASRMLFRAIVKKIDRQKIALAETCAEVRSLS